MTTNLIRWCTLACVLACTGVIRAAAVLPANDADSLITGQSEVALIHRAQNTQTLSVQTTITTGGTKYLWLTAAPDDVTIEVDDDAHLSAVQTAFAPRVVHQVFPLWAYAMVIVLLLLLLMQRRYNMAIAYVLIVAVSLAARGVVTRSALPGFEPPLRYIAFSAGKTSPLTVQATHTLAATSTDELMQWINEHGYAAPASLLPIAQGYIDAGWRFVLVELAGESFDHPSRRTTPALTMRFTSDQTLYPLRLNTLAGSADAQSLTLFNFDTLRLQGTLFQATHCQVLQPPATQRIDPRLHVEPATVVTRLSATLRPAQMMADPLLERVGVHLMDTRYHSREAAMTTSLNLAVPLALIGLLIISYQAGKGRLTYKTALAATLGVTLLAGLLGFVKHQSITTIDASREMMVVDE